MSGFLPRSVYEARLARILRFLEETDVGALVVTDGDNFTYLTNFLLDVATWERPVAVVIPRWGRPVAVMCELSTNHLQAARDRGTFWLDEVVIYSEHPRVRNRTYTVNQWGKLVADLLASRRLRAGRVAVDVPQGPWRRVLAENPALETVDASWLLREMRAVKCPEEQALIRQAAALTDWGQAAYRQNVAPGRLVAEVDLETAKQMAVEGARRHPGCALQVRVFSLAGPASASPHGTGADCDLTFAPGQVIVNIIIVRLNGYVVENERTWFLGEPSPEAARAFQVAVEAQRAAIAAMVAGTPLAEVDAQAQEVIERAGYGDYILHRTGHGMGLAGHEWPHDMAFNPRPLRAGEVLSAEPGIYIPGLGGFRHDDTVIVGVDRPEVVTTWSRDVEELTIPC